MQALNDYYDTVDWTVTLDSQAPIGAANAVLIALRQARQAPQEGRQLIPGVDVLPAPAASATAPTAAPSTAPTARPSSPPSRQPVFPQAPVPGAGLAELPAGQAAAVVAGVTVRATDATVTSTTVEVSVPSDRIGVRMSASSVEGDPVDLDAKGRVLMQPGGTVRVEAYGFRPGSLVDVWLYSTPLHLGSTTVDAQGNVDHVFAVPSALAVGEHTLKLDGLTASGKLSTIAVGVVATASLVTVSPSTAATVPGSPAVSEAPSASASSASPSGTVTVLVVLVLLLLAGALLVLVRRRRRHASTRL